MEQHPVPQNVTTFQFRLIGDMTIKQFGYLASGALAAYICYKLPLPFFFTLPLAAGSALLGFGLAFIPIEERPMDVWILSFFKNVYSPTQYVWSRIAPQQVNNTTIRQIDNSTKQQSNMSTMQHIDKTTKPQDKAVKASMWSVIDNLFPAKKTAPFAPKPTPQTATHAPAPMTFDMPPKVVAPSAPQPTPASVFPTTPVPEVSGTHPKDAEASKVSEASTVSAVSKATEEVEKKEQALETQVADLQKELAGKDAADSRVLELQKQLTALIAEHDRMEKELITLKRQADQPSATSQQTTAKPAVIATPTTPTPTISVMSADVALKAGLPRLTTYPNVVTGILKDNTKNLLPGVLVTVRDLEGIPLRALKTNRLGQFAASTPLPNGTYLVEVEDPRRRYVFDRVQITLNGSIVPVLEIVAKSQRDLSRAQMAKDLFGGQMT